jgi:hypothetical protein
MMLLPFQIPSAARNASHKGTTMPPRPITRGKKNGRMGSLVLQGAHKETRRVFAEKLAVSNHSGQGLLAQTYGQMRNKTAIPRPHSASRRSLNPMWRSCREVFANNDGGSNNEQKKIYVPDRPEAVKPVRAKYYQQDQARPYGCWSARFGTQNNTPSVPRGLGRF